jgi:serine/threonine protein kinase
MVAVRDGNPTVKVIDFGVAKAINQRLTDKTVWTTQAQVVGTPMYMSPEQAESGEMDVDTRSDVYSLGALLYELLVGTTPIGRAEFKDATYDEVQRLIRHVDPPCPSDRRHHLAGFFRVPRATRHAVRRVSAASHWSRSKSVVC